MAMILATKTYCACIDANPNEAIQDPGPSGHRPGRAYGDELLKQPYRTYAYEDILL